MSWALAIPAAASAVNGMAGQAGALDDASQKRRAALAAAMGVPLLDLPDEDYSYLDYAGDYNPYAIGAPKLAEYQQVADSPETRAIQMQALQKLIAQGNGAADAQNQAAQFSALDAANQQANAREGAIRQSMERKGQGGTGVNALMRAQAAQMGANRAAQGTLDAASQAALMKLQALGAAGNAAGQMRGQDVGLNSQNAGIINDFNRFNVAAQNRVAEQNVENRNAAQLRNLNTRQDISGRNTGIRNSGVDQRRNNALTEHTANANRTGMIINGINNQAVGAQNAGNAYNQMGQQGQQLFTNIGSGIAAAQNAKQPDNEYTSDDGSFHSQWW